MGACKQMNRYTKEQIALAMFETNYTDLWHIQKDQAIILSDTLTDSKLSSVFEAMGKLLGDNGMINHYYLTTAARLHEGLADLDKRIDRCSGRVSK